MFVDYRGAARSRAGTEYVLRSKTFVGATVPDPRIISFQFNINQGYILELGQNYMRFFTNGAAVTEAPFNISGVTQSNPCYVTIPGADYSDGDWVFFTGILGMTPLNGRYFLVAPVSLDTYQLSTLDAEDIDASAFPAYIAGGTSARVYEIGTPWLASDIALLKFTQSADVMSFTHPSYPPYDLARIAENLWTLTQTDFESQQAPPATVTATATVHPSQATSPPTLPCAYDYVVTAVSTSGQESVASTDAPVTDSVDMSVTAGSIVVTWSPVAGAVQYNVYRAPPSYNSAPGDLTNAVAVPAGAIFNFVGSTFGCQFVDSNTVADATRSPPSHQDPFAPGQITNIEVTAGGSGYTVAGAIIESATGSGFSGQVVVVNYVVQAVIIFTAGENYLPDDQLIIVGDGAGATGTISVGPSTGTWPSLVSYFQQRRVYSNSNNQPDTYWMSKPGDFTNFDTSPISQASDAITGTPWAQQVNGIQWLLQMPGGLITLTGKSAWQVTGEGGSALNPQPITPSSQQAQQQAFNGVSPLVPPIPVNFNILYVTSKGTDVRDFIYNYFTNNWAGTSQTILSSHLFTGFDIIQWAYCEEPNKIIWAIRCDGVLLSFTYMKEQEVYGWARHDTAGQFVSVASVTEPPVDALYVIAKRPWGPPSLGGQAYLIERMDNRIWQTAEEPWCVDGGLQTGLAQPNVPISASSTFGSVIFSSAAPAFPLNSVGSVLRIGGGIAQITAFANDQQISGFWILPPTQLVPN
jgi:hypothetical protein